VIPQHGFAQPSSLALGCLPPLSYPALCVLLVQVVRREGQSRGFGFVTFQDEISVEKCLLVNHFIKGKKVELKRAVPKVRPQNKPSPARSNCM
jgi:hypothetical protein